MKKTLLFLVFALLATPAFAADHYVYAAAAGTGDGSNWTNAFTCIPTDANLVRGDTYWIGPGDYRETCDAAAARTFLKAASSGLVITFRRAIASNHGAAADWQASYGTGQAIFHPLRFQSNDWMLDGQTRTDYRTGYLLRVTSIKPDGISSYNAAGATWIVGTGCSSCGSGGTSSSNDTIQYVEIIGTRDLGTNTALTENGIRIYSNGTSVSTNISVNHNSITKPGNSQIDVYCNNFTEEYNWLAYNWSTPTSHAEGNALKGSFTNNIVRYNIFEDMFGTAFIATPGAGGTSTPNGLYVYGNVFMRSLDNPEGLTGALGDGTIRILSCTAISNVFVYNNTTVNMDSAISGSPRIFSTSPQTNPASVCYPNGGSVVNFTAENNLWYSNSNVDNSNSPCGTCTGTYTWDYNSYYDTTATADSSANKKSYSGVNPFVSYSTKNFHLAAATDAGITLASPYNVDPEGNIRGADGVWDRGVYEFLAGTGPPALLQLSTSAVNFGSQTVGTTSAPHTVVLQNVSSSTLTFTSIVESGSEYSMTNPCPGSLTQNQSCTLSITFTPAASGARPQGTITITSNGTGSPQTITLNGTGLTQPAIGLGIGRPGGP